MRFVSFFLVLAILSVLGLWLLGTRAPAAGLPSEEAPAMIDAAAPLADTAARSRADRGSAAGLR